MFNLYKYLFLIIINLSLAQKIDRCNIFDAPGIYTLDKISIDDNVYHNITIDIREIANLTYSESDQYGTFLSYTISGTIKYIKNNEIFEINFLYCSHFNSKNESIKKSYITLSDDFINSKDPFKNSILSSNIINFESIQDALKRSYQNLYQILHQDVSSSNVIDTYFPLDDQEEPPKKKINLMREDVPKDMQLASKSTIHRPNKMVSSMAFQEPQGINMELMTHDVESDKPTKALSRSKIASQSNSDKAGRSIPLTDGFDEEIKKNRVPEIKNISVLNKNKIIKIIKDLEKSKSIVLMDESSVYKGIQYTKIIVNYSEIISSAKSYNITLFDNKGKETTYIDQFVDVFVEDHKLKFRFYSRDVEKTIDIDNPPERIEGDDSELSIENFNLYILATLHPEESLGEIKKADSQIISDLNPKDSQNSVSLIRNITPNNQEAISIFLLNLNDGLKLVFTNNKYFNKKIQITNSEKKDGMFGVKYYNISIKSGTEIESFNDKTISLTAKGSSLYCRIQSNSKEGRFLKVFTITNFQLSISTNTTN